MKKMFLLIILIFPVLLLSGCNTSKVMNGIMSSWEGCDLNEVIDQWGYPTDERTLAGRKLYYWEYLKSAYMPQSTTGTVRAYGNTAHYNETSSGGHVISGLCTRILEVNKDNKVIKWQWGGNNCPFAEWFEYKTWRNKSVFLYFQDERFKEEVLKAYELINSENLTKYENEKISLILSKVRNK